MKDKPGTSIGTEVGERRRYRRVKTGHLFDALPTSAFVLTAGTGVRYTLAKRGDIYLGGAGFWVDTGGETVAGVIYGWDCDADVYTLVKLDQDNQGHAVGLVVGPWAVTSHLALDLQWDAYVQALAPGAMLPIRMMLSQCCGNYAEIERFRSRKDIGISSVDDPAVFGEDGPDVSVPRLRAKGNFLITARAEVYQGEETGCHESPGLVLAANEQALLKLLGAGLDAPLLHVPTLMKLASGAHTDVTIACMLARLGQDHAYSEKDRQALSARAEELLRDASRSTKPAEGGSGHTRGHLAKFALAQLILVPHRRLSDAKKVLGTIPKVAEDRDGLRLLAVIDLLEGNHDSAKSKLVKVLKGSRYDTAAKFLLAYLLEEEARKLRGEVADDRDFDPAEYAFLA